VLLRRGNDATRAGAADGDPSSKSDATKIGSFAFAGTGGTNHFHSTSSTTFADAVHCIPSAVKTYSLRGTARAVGSIARASEATVVGTTRAIDGISVTFDTVAVKANSSAVSGISIATYAGTRSGKSGAVNSIISTNRRTPAIRSITIYDRIAL
jgi:hypothetical protein